MVKAQELLWLPPELHDAQVAVSLLRNVKHKSDRPSHVSCDKVEVASKHNGRVSYK